MHPSRSVIIIISINPVVVITIMIIKRFANNNGYDREIKKKNLLARDMNRMFISPLQALVVYIELNVFHWQGI